MDKQKSPDMDLITAVVRNSLADTVLRAAINAGAPGITFFSAQGMGIKEFMGYVGSLIEHEKRVLWVVTERKDTEKVLEAIAQTANLNLPGEGFAFVQPVNWAVGFIDPDKFNEQVK